jgi:hypothetical protein
MISLTFSKNIAVLLVLLSGACASTGFLMAGAQVTLYGAAYAPKLAVARIDVYNTSRPNVGFVEIGQITCADTNDAWSMKQILIKARQIGADGIIITGRAGAYGVGVPIGSMAMVTTQSYGITAIAIKYQ